MRVNWIWPGAALTRSLTIGKHCNVCNNDQKENCLDQFLSQTQFIFSNKWNVMFNCTSLWSLCYPRSVVRRSAWGRLSCNSTFWIYTSDLSLLSMLSGLAEDLSADTDKQAEQLTQLGRATTNANHFISKSVKHWLWQILKSNKCECEKQKL